MQVELNRPHVIERIEFDEYSWFFRFSADEWLRVECLWRIVGEAILLTSKDNGQRFGLENPIDAAVRARELLQGEIRSISWDDETGDLTVAGGQHRLQVLTDSSGYEAWELYIEGRGFLGRGGEVLH